VIDASPRRPPLAIFFDDFEKIVTTEVRGVVDAPAAHAGPAPAARHRHARHPDLGIARLRASGQLAEIGPTAALHARGNAPLSPRGRGDAASRPEDVAFLHERSEGWPAALQLATLASATSPGAPRACAILAARSRRWPIPHGRGAHALPEDLREFS
jgi:LuxR family maltose regulon positive regulatory protein